jgi:hypothetical protein
MSCNIDDIRVRTVEWSCSRRLVSTKYNFQRMAALRTDVKGKFGSSRVVGFGFGFGFVLRVLSCHETGSELQGMAWPCPGL